MTRDPGDKKCSDSSIEESAGVEISYVDEEWRVQRTDVPADLKRIFRTGRRPTVNYVDSPPITIPRPLIVQNLKDFSVPSTSTPAPCFPLLGSERFSLNDERVAVTFFRLVDPIEGSAELQGGVRDTRVVGFSVERHRDRGETRVRDLFVNWRRDDGTFTDAVYIIHNSPDEVGAPGLQRVIDSGSAIAAAAGELAERDTDHLSALRKDYEELFGGQPKTNFKGFRGY